MCRERDEEMREYRYLLVAENQALSVFVPLIVESFEAVGRESDGGRRGKCTLILVEEIQESVLW